MHKNKFVLKHLKEEQQQFRGMTRELTKNVLIIMITEQQQQTNTDVQAASETTAKISLDRMVNSAYSKQNKKFQLSVGSEQNKNKIISIKSVFIVMS